MTATSAQGPANLYAKPFPVGISEEYVTRHNELFDPIHELDMKTSSQVLKGTMVIAIAIAMIILFGLAMAGTVTVGHIGLPMILLGMAVIGMAGYNQVFKPLFHGATALVDDAKNHRLALLADDESDIEQPQGPQVRGRNRMPLNTGRYRR